MVQLHCATMCYVATVCWSVTLTRHPLAPCIARRALSRTALQAVLSLSNWAAGKGTVWTQAQLHCFGVSLLIAILDLHLGLAVI